MHMAALNDDNIVWINIAILGAINSNETYLYFMWELKTLKRQGVHFLLETKHKVFRFKTKPIPRMPVHDCLTVASRFLSPTLNFQ